MPHTTTHSLTATVANLVTNSAGQSAPVSVSTGFHDNRQVTVTTAAPGLNSQVQSTSTSSRPGILHQCAPSEPRLIVPQKIPLTKEEGEILGANFKEEIFRNFKKRDDASMDFKKKVKGFGKYGATALMHFYDMPDVARQFINFAQTQVPSTSSSAQGATVTAATSLHREPLQHNSRQNAAAENQEESNAQHQMVRGYEQIKRSYYEELNELTRQTSLDHQGNDSEVFSGGSGSVASGPDFLSPPQAPTEQEKAEESKRALVDIFSSDQQITIEDGLGKLRNQGVFPEHIKNIRSVMSQVRNNSYNELMAKQSHPLVALFISQVNQFEVGPQSGDGYAGIFNQYLSHIPRGSMPGSSRTVVEHSVPPQHQTPCTLGTLIEQHFTAILRDFTEAQVSLLVNQASQDVRRPGFTTGMSYEQFKVQASRLLWLPNS